MENVRKSRIAKVICDGCGLVEEVVVNIKSEPIVLFENFIDKGSADEVFQKLVEYIEILKKRNDRKEIILCYYTLLNISYAKIIEALEDKDSVTFEEVNKWEHKAGEIHCQLESLKSEKFGVRKGVGFYPYSFGFKRSSFPGVERFCKYCKSVIASNEKFCSVCGKKS